MAGFMDAGQLDRRIKIRRALVTYNAFNEPIETWRDLVTVWAKRQDVSASERYRAAEVDAELTTRFTIRWSAQLATVSERDRIQFDRGDYNVVAVRGVERRLWIEIDAVRRQDKSVGTTFDSVFTTFDSASVTWDAA